MQKYGDKMDEKVFMKRFQKMCGAKYGLTSAQRIATRVAAKLQISQEEAAQLVTITYKAILQDFQNEGVLRLPWGLLVQRTSDLPAKIRDRYICGNPALELPEAVKNDPPFVLFSSGVVTTLMAIELEDEIQQTQGITPEMLAKRCIYGVY